MPVSKEEVEAMIADANATADKHLEDRYNSAKVEAKQLSDKVVEWLQAKPITIPNYNYYRLGFPLLPLEAGLPPL